MSKISIPFVLLLVLLRAALGAPEPGSLSVAGTHGGALDAPAGSGLTVHLSAAFVKQMVRQTSEDSEDYDERIIRAEVHGISRTSSVVDAELIDDRGSVVIDLVIRGTTVTDSMGWQGPVKIYTISHTPFVARKRMRLNADGVTATAPVIDVSATLCLDRITDRADRSNFPLANVAQRIYRRTEPEANRQIECSARRRVHSRVDREAAPHLKSVQLGHSAVREFLETQVGQRPQKLHFFSTPTSANVALAIDDPGRADKITAPPSLPASWDVAIRVHEKVINDLAQTVLAGKTYPLDRLESLGDELFDWFQARLNSSGKPGTKNTAAEKKPTDEDVSITFARTDPLRITFADRRLEVVAQIANYRVGAEDFEGFRLHLSYQVQAENRQFAMLRQGPPRIEPVGTSGKQKKLTRSEHSFLRQAFGTGTERIPLSALHLPAPWNEAGVLTPENLEARNGWLLVAWRRQ